MQYTDRDSRIGTGVNMSIKVPIRISHQMASITCFLALQSESRRSLLFRDKYIHASRNADIWPFCERDCRTKSCFPLFLPFSVDYFVDPLLRMWQVPLAQKVSKRFHNCLFTRGRKITRATCFLSET